MAMGNNKFLYPPNSTNIGIDSYPSGAFSLLSSSSSSSSSSPSSSMGMIFADMSSLSISPNYESTFLKSSDRENERRACWGTFPFMQKCNSRESDVGEGKGSSECSDGFGDNGNEIIDLNASLSEEKPSNSVQVVTSGQSKLCARGHWRPAEDTKLRELVALYGPQNWNLIAEKLEGRSGKKVCYFFLITNV